jgi:hypothetical protein
MGPGVRRDDDLFALAEGETRWRGMTVNGRVACIQTPSHLLLSASAKVFQPGAREIVMAKGQMRSNKEKKKPKADKNLKKGGATPSPFSSGKTPAGQSPNSKKS